MLGHNDISYKCRIIKVMDSGEPEDVSLSVESVAHKKAEEMFSGNQVIAGITPLLLSLPLYNGVLLNLSCAQTRESFWAAHL